MTTKPTNEKMGLNEIMKRAQEMQKKLQDIQKQVADYEVIGQSSGGAIKIAMSGTHIPNRKRTDIDVNLLKEDKSTIIDHLCDAIADATAKIEKNLQDKMGGLAGMKLPEGFDDLPK